MSVIVAGFVKNGVVVPAEPLPEGAQGEIRWVNGWPKKDLKLHVFA